MPSSAISSAAEVAEALSGSAGDSAEGELHASPRSDASSAALVAERVMRGSEGERRERGRDMQSSVVKGSWE